MAKSKLMLLIINLYLIYALVAGLIIYALPTSKQKEYENQVDPQRFYGVGKGVDRVVLLENPYLASLARHDLIVNAKNTIDIAYYSLHSDYSTEAFFGALFEAADRGVKIRILLDGISHGMTGSLRDVRYAALHHENIEIKLYEPLDLLRPWTWNNRYHDKYIIADNVWGIIGGRNIELRFFNPEIKSPVRDRDVLIMNTAQDSNSESVLHQLQAYYDWQWDHPYCRYAKAPLKNSAEKLILRGKERTEQVIDGLRSFAQNYFTEEIPWDSLAFPTNKITLIHNPLKRLSHEPKILMEIAALIKNAQKSIFMQSPYFIPTKKMGKFLPDLPIDAQISIITNDPASPGNPNYPATAGYLNKKRIVEHVSDKIYEFYDSSSIHAKTYVFDSRLSLIGSFNFDARSSFLSTESMVVIDSSEFAQHLELKMQELVNEGISTQKPSLTRAAIIWLLRVLLWPFDFLL